MNLLSSYSFAYLASTVNDAKNNAKEDMEGGYDIVEGDDEGFKFFVEEMSDAENDNDNDCKEPEEDQDPFTDKQRDEFEKEEDERLKKEIEEEFAARAQHLREAAKEQKHNETLAPMVQCRRTGMAKAT